MVNLLELQRRSEVWLKKSDIRAHIDIHISTAFGEGYRQSTQTKGDHRYDILLSAEFHHTDADISFSVARAITQIYCQHKYGNPDMSNEITNRLMSKILMEIRYAKKPVITQN